MSGRRSPVARGARYAAALAIWGVLSVAPSAPLAAQVVPAMRAEVRDRGPGDPGRVLAEVLAAPHVLLTPAAGPLALPRDSVIGSTIVVIGSDVTVASQVAGDVVVIGGDLFIRPGARITGRAIAFGGGVYDSRLASVEGDILAFRDETFDVAREPGVLALSYRRVDVRPRATFALPGFYGLRLPGYSRVDGAIVPVGAALLLQRLSVEIDAVATYRSHLGTVDPSLALRRSVDRRTDVEVVAERGTYTNDAWARGDLVNAATTFVFGDDERNYYRATRVGGRVTRRWEGAATVVEPWLGVRTEDARSVGPVRGATSAPWSIFGRDDTTRILRPNPAVLDGRISSAFVGSKAAWDADAFVASGDAWVEVPFDAVGERRFAQLTLNAATQFTTVRDHRLDLAAHLVLTAGDTAPPQRYAYLGGGSTIPTLDELTLGGDQLVFVEGTYLVPLSRPVLPVVGAPSVGLRYLVGSAGVQRLPTFTQNVGVRVLLSLLRFDLLVDPATGDVNYGVGGSFTF